MLPSVLPLPATPLSRVSSRRLRLNISRADSYSAMRSPLLMEGPKTIAGEKGTVSERSFVMVSLSAKLNGRHS